MNSGLTSHHEQGHTETGPWFKVSSQRLGKWEFNLAIPYSGDWWSNVHKVP